MLFYSVEHSRRDTCIGHRARLSGGSFKQPVVRLLHGSTESSFVTASQVVIYTALGFHAAECLAL